MTRTLPRLGLLLVALGCTPLVGDECTTNADCGTALVCDSSQPAGYCTRSPCTPNSCPEEAVCIEFPDESTWCMARCESSGDCRDDYVCVDNYGDLPFCNPQPFVAAP